MSPESELNENLCFLILGSESLKVFMFKMGLSVYFAGCKLVAAWYV